MEENPWMPMNPKICLNHPLEVIRNIQSNQEYFSFMVKFHDVESLFDLQKDLLPELRAQRPINKARVTQIKNYLFENLDSFVFPSVTACTAVDPNFQPYFNTGLVGTITLTEKLHLHDGQHRIAGIIEFIKKVKYLELHPKCNKQILDRLDGWSGLNSIPVTLFYDLGLKRSRQIFSDINRFAVKPKRELLVNFDTRPKVS